MKASHSYWDAFVVGTCLKAVEFLAREDFAENKVVFNLFTDYKPSDGYSAVVDAVGEAASNASADATPALVTASEDDSPDVENEERESGRIEDFGEKIGGARKDVYSAFKATFLQITEQSIADEPLSKSWPVPKYDKLLEAGVPKWKVAALRALREAITPKPKGRKWYAYGKNWCKQVAELRCLAVCIMKDDLSLDGFYEYLRKHSTTFDFETDGRKNSSDLTKRQEHSSLFDSQISGLYLATAMYSRLGHDMKMENLRAEYYARPSFFRFNNKEMHDCFRISVEQSAGRYSYSKTVGAAQNLGEAIAILTDYFGKLREEHAVAEADTAASKKRKPIQFHTLKWKNEDYIFVGRKYNGEWIEVAKPFKTWNEAREYIQDHQDELEEKFEQFKYVPFERYRENQPRMVDGNPAIPEHITPEKFAETFGFRGVEFGNWVENDKRQKDLDEAYYALMDLAHVINLPPRALSLGGELGLAFGARGIGGRNAASAHYEPDYVVINLTKKNGAGALAHEWFHAADHYFGRHKSVPGQYMTDSREAKVSEAEFESHYDRYRDDGIRREMQEAFARVVRAFKADPIKDTSVYKRSAKLDKYRTDVYWSEPTEMGARCFEAYVKAKLKDEGISNDFLVNIMSPVDWEKEAEKNPERLDDTYPYPTKQELADVTEAYDAFFAAVGTRTDEKGNTVLYSSSDYSRNRQMRCNFVCDDELTAGQTALRDIVRESMGLDIEFFRGAPELHGMLDPDFGTVLLNADSERPLDETLWHEAFHAMKRIDPALYERVAAFAEERHPITQEQMDAFRNSVNGSDLPESVCREEILANAFADAKIRQARLNEMAEEKPGLMQRVTAFMVNTADRIKAALGLAPCKGQLDDVQMRDFEKGIRKLQEQAARSMELPSGACRILMGDAAALRKEILLRDAMTNPWLLEKNPGPDAETGKGIQGKLAEETAMHLSKLGYKKKLIEHGMRDVLKLKGAKLPVPAPSR